MNAVLVVAPAWIGDMVMAQSLFRILKLQDAGRPIDVLAPGWTLPLLQHMPEVRDGIEMPLGHGELQLGVRYRIGFSLRERGYEWAIILPNSFKSALVPLWARIPRRTGYTGEMRQCLLNDSRRLDRQGFPRMVQRLVALAIPASDPLPEPIPRPVLAVSSASGRAAAKRLDLASDTTPVLVLCPGAEYGSAKQWPEDYYGRVARHWIGTGWQVWLLGSAHDAAVCERIAEVAGDGCISLAGRTTLREAIELMNLAAFIITNDSGLMHIAAALQRPMVALFGSSDPGFTPPLSASARVEWLDLECSPCFARECPPGHLKCLRELQPERVIAAMEEVMSR
jgi:heptosyltransferase-2